MRVALTRFTLPLVRPLVTAAGTIASREGWLVAVEEGGWRGVGEASPLPGWSDETLADVEEQLRSWVPEVGEARVALPSPAARHGAEQALMDWVGASTGRTLAEVLGAQVDEVPLNALVADPAGAVDAVARGFRTLKIKVAVAPVDDDVARVAAIRAAVGPSVALRLDANRGWSLAQAERALQAMFPLGLELVEEPVAGLAGLASLRHLARIAVDESLRGHADLDAILTAGAADVAVIKPMLVGGPVEALALLRRTRSAGLEAFVTTSIDGAVGREAALAVAAAAPGPLACGLDTGRLLAADVGPSFAIRGGSAVVPRGRAA